MMLHKKYPNFHVKNLPLVYTLEDKFEDTLYDYQGTESLNPNYEISRQCTYVCRDLQIYEEVILSWVQTGIGVSNHITLF